MQPNSKIKSVITVILSLDQHEIEEHRSENVCRPVKQFGNARPSRI